VTLERKRDLASDCQDSGPPALLWRAGKRVKVRTLTVRTFLFAVV
jgi:hypothetical protein